MQKHKHHTLKVMALIGSFTGCLMALQSSAQQADMARDEEPVVSEAMQLSEETLEPTQQPENQDQKPVPLDAELFITSTGENTIENGIFTARQNVELLYGPISLYADEMSYDTSTGWARAEGNARLFRGDGTLLLADRLEYNTRSGEVRTSTSRGVMLPYVFSTLQTESKTDTESSTKTDSSSAGKDNRGLLHYLLTGAQGSLENVQRPGFRITSRSVQHRPDINRTVFRNVTMYAGNIPIMWWPKITYQPGSSDFALQATPGFNSEWGAFLLLAYGLELRPGLYTKPRLDFRSSRGVAAGLDTHWFHGKRLNSTKGEHGQGEFNFYIADDSDPQRTPEEGRPNHALRYRFQAREKFYFTETRDFYASITGDVLSDAGFVRDFFPVQYLLQRQPDNHVEILKRLPHAQFSVLARPQLNPFFETVERLPEVRLDVPRKQLLAHWPVYYGGQNSFVRLQRRFADNDKTVRPFSDYNALRFDTYHELSSPIKLLKALQLVASAGWRGTYYDDSHPRVREIVPEKKKFRFRDNIRILDKDTVIKYKKLSGTGGGSLFRSLFSLNLDGSLKLHRVYNFSKPALGIDRLRHVVEPWFHFSYIPRPWKSSHAQIMQFDQRFGSTRLDPLHFPQYNSVDDIPERITLRLGIDQRLQTNRDGQNYTLVRFSTYLDIDPWQKTYPNATSNLFSEINISPLPWLMLGFLTSTDLHNSGYHEYNSYLQWQIAQPVLIRLSHRFLDNSDIFRDSNQLSTQLFWRIDDNWAVATRHTFEFSDTSINSQSNYPLRSQEYSIYRDLSSWRAALAVQWANNNNRKDEFSVFLSFTLKAFPDVRIPLSYTEGAADIGSGTSLSP